MREALKRLLWPLPPGGIDGGGWPLGRDVREREIEVEISRVAGVLEVGGINLFRRADGVHGPEWRLLPRNTADPTQSLALEDWQLPELLSVLVVDGAPGEGAPERSPRAAQSLCRCRCGRRAGGARGLLMDANGLRFWLLADAAHWPARAHTAWHAECGTLRLASERRLTAPVDLDGVRRGQHRA